MGGSLYPRIAEGFGRMGAPESALRDGARPASYPSRRTFWPSWVPSGFTLRVPLWAPAGFFRGPGSRKRMWPKPLASL